MFTTHSKEEENDKKISKKVHKKVDKQSNPLFTVEPCVLLRFRILPTTLATHRRVEKKATKHTEVW